MSRSYFLYIAKENSTVNPNEQIFTWFCMEWNEPRKLTQKKKEHGVRFTVNILYQDQVLPVLRVPLEIEKPSLRPSLPS